MSKFNIGDMVEVFNFRDSIGYGTIIELWAGSLEEKSSGFYGLQKYKIKLHNSNSTTWRYNSDIIAISNI